MATIEIRERIDSADVVHAVVILPWEKRQKYRFRAETGGGEAVSIMLPRNGPALREGDLLQSVDGRVMEVRAAPEMLSTAACDDLLLFSRACYHLGNRHTPVEITGRAIYYASDHVLDDMLRLLGLTVTRVERPFQPESGAYAQGSGHHQH